ncbi:MFS transporter [Nocardia colli]|uniref:MFS transporter n=1 Tax=Nocardia colli TaxID=2545717 RepID=UPI001CC5E9FB|nr:MFS transporter [Nocardia colli]
MSAPPSISLSSNRKRWFPELLRDVSFRRYWTGQTVSTFGDQISFVVIPLVAVLVTHADAAQMGYLVAAGWLPHLLFGLHAGVWADRRARRRRVMIAADLGRFVLVASVPVVYLFDGLTLAQLYAVAFSVGTLSVLFDVCNAPLFPALVAPQRYVAGNSLINGSRAMSQMAGPSVGGLLVQLLSAPVALLADALSFLVSALTLSRITPAEPPAQQAVRGQLAEGIRFIARSPIMRSALAATATVNFFTLMVVALFMLYAIDTLHLEPGSVGLVLGAGAVGGLLGALTAGRLADRIGIGPTFVLGCLVFPAPMLLIPAAHGSAPVVLILLTAAEFGSGLGMMWLDIAASSLFTAITPDPLRSRVFGAYRAVNYGVRPLGSLAGGTLATAIGLRPTLWTATIAALTAFLFLLPSPIPRLETCGDAAEEGIRARREVG